MRYLILLPLLLFACSQKGRQPTPAPAAEGIIVQTIGASAVTPTLVASERKLLGEANIHRVSSPAGPRLSAQVKLRKAQLFEREFLYSLVTQSSSSEKVAKSFVLLTYLEPFRFRRMGEQLQAVSDQRLQFGSDATNPERLLNSFRIVNEDEESLTIEVREAAPVIPSYFSDEHKNKAIRSSWVRSASLSPDGLYVLLETSLETKDGDLAQIFESFFPRELVVDQGAKPLYATEDGILGKRFELLKSTEVWLESDGIRVKRQPIRHWGHILEKPVEWYIGSNTPLDMEANIKAGVEGWNRYSQKMWSKDVVRFRGQLPEGVKFGDPRYNVIQYTSSESEGTVYASSVSDLETGIIGFAGVRLPLAYLASEDANWDGFEFTLLPHRNGSILEAIRPRPALPGIGKEEHLGHAIKSVILHEIGHTLGINHNFKGSLTFDPADPSSAFASSTMEYLAFEHEPDLFWSLESSAGPILEYDRQALSALYNDGKDISDDDPELPSCSDAEKVLETGIDPLCTPSDLGKDPTEILGRDLELLRNPLAKTGKVQSLPATLALLSANFDELAKRHTSDEDIASIPLLATISFYYNRLQTHQEKTQKFFYLFDPAAVEDLEDVEGMRWRVLESLRYLLNLKEFEPATKTAIEDYEKKFFLWWEKRPSTQSLSVEERTARRKEIEKLLAYLIRSHEENSTFKAAHSLYPLLGFRTDVALYLNTEEGTDLEEEFSAILAAAVLRKKDPKGGEHVLAHRQAAAKALQTYSAAPSHSGRVAETRLALRKQLKEANTTEERQQLYLLLKALKDQG